MLTVDYHRLELRAGHRLLDLGCGFGRHAYESLRRGAHVVACDMAIPELVEVRITYGAMAVAGEVAGDTLATAVTGDATCLPFDDESFDRIIASEVMEHIPDDAGAITELTRVLRPGGIIAVTVPSWFPEQICWKLSDEYYAPKSEGGHVRIYRKSDLQERMTDAGLEPFSSHRAHSLHSPYWWLRCAVGPTNDEQRFVKLYNRFLTWDIMKTPTSTRVADKILNPVLGKSLVQYARKPARVRTTIRDHHVAA
ncbi:MAG: class I SAM-dependent methyltransferase [Acidimicrobiia bacterium]|nr:class I SAM-dependent methyltransferase [Acidimicrobiia bacterium]